MVGEDAGDRFENKGDPRNLGVSCEGPRDLSVDRARGELYVRGNGFPGRHFCVDEETGKQLWATRIGGSHSDEYGGPRGTPSVDGALVYAIGTDGQVVCLDAASGKERWRRSFTRDFGGVVMGMWQWAESPLVDGDRVIVTPGAPSAGIVALDKLTGKEVWRAAIPRLGPNGDDGSAEAMGRGCLTPPVGHRLFAGTRLVDRQQLQQRAHDRLKRARHGFAPLTSPMISIAARARWPRPLSS